MPLILPLYQISQNQNEARITDMVDRMVNEGQMSVVFNEGEGERETLLHNIIRKNRLMKF